MCRHLAGVNPLAGGALSHEVAVERLRRPYLCVCGYACVRVRVRVCVRVRA
jgi:hypothetical protein